MRNKKETNRKIAQAIKVTMLISIPSAVGLFVFAKPVVLLLYPQRATVDLVASLIRAMAVAVVFYALSTLTNAVLQGTGRVNKPVFHALISLIIQTVVLVPLLLYTNMNLYALCLATVLYSLLMCIMNGGAIHRHLEYKQETLKTFVLPFFAAFWMGVISGAVYLGLNQAIKLLTSSGESGFSDVWSNIICLLPSLIVAVLVYFILVLKLGAIGKNELKSMPKGHLLLKIAKKTHLIH